VPTALITTPESLSLLLSRPDARERFGQLKMVVIDEWHELIGNKRGVQTQLALARLRHCRPEIVTWGLSATLGNLEYAMDVLDPTQGSTQADDVGRFARRVVRRLVRGTEPKVLTLDTLLPPGLERFPWAGHLGLRMLPQVVEEIGKSETTLVFTNTRSQSERWYQRFSKRVPTGQAASQSITARSIARRARGSSWRSRTES
jgi:ATP-dependent Lhr-like helicase